MEDNSFELNTNRRVLWKKMPMHLLYDDLEIKILRVCN